MTTENRPTANKNKLFFINRTTIKYFNCNIFQNCSVKKDAILHLPNMFIMLNLTLHFAVSISNLKTGVCTGNHGFFPLYSIWSNELYCHSLLRMPCLYNANMHHSGKIVKV